MEKVAKDAHALAKKLQKMNIEQESEDMAKLADKLDAIAQGGGPEEHGHGDMPENEKKKMLAEQADQIAKELRKNGKKKEANKVQDIKKAAAKAKSGPAMEKVAKDAHALAKKLQKMNVEQESEDMAKLADELDQAAQAKQEEEGKK